MSTVTTQSPHAGPPAVQASQSMSIEPPQVKRGPVSGRPGAGTSGR